MCRWDGVKYLNLKRKGLLLLESLTAFFISLIIIFTLTYCVTEQLKLLNYWEERATADKVIWLHLKRNNIPDPLIVAGRKYYYHQQNNLYQVKVNNHVYSIKK